MILRTIAPFLHSASALSLVWRGREGGLGAQLFEQANHVAVNVLAAAVGMKAGISNRKLSSSIRMTGSKMRFADALDGGHPSLGHDVNCVDLVDPVIQSRLP